MRAVRGNGDENPSLARAHTTPARRTIGLGWPSPAPNGNAASARRAVGVSVREQRPACRVPARLERWTATLAELWTLQEEYETWCGQSPESPADSRTAELLKEICQLDLGVLDLKLPRGFGRDRNARRTTPTPGSWKI